MVKVQTLGWRVFQVKEKGTLKEKHTPVSPLFTTSRESAEQFAKLAKSKYGDVIVKEVPVIDGAFNQ